MKNIKYTTTNKCKSKVFLTNFSILLKCEKEKKFFLLMSREREETEKLRKIGEKCAWERTWARSEQRAGRAKTDLRDDGRNRWRASGRIFGHKKLFYCSIYYDFYGFEWVRCLMDSFWIAKYSENPRRNLNNSLAELLISTSARGNAASFEAEK